MAACKIRIIHPWYTLKLNVDIPRYQIQNLVLHHLAFYFENNWLVKATVIITSIHLQTVPREVSNLINSLWRVYWKEKKRLSMELRGESFPAKFKGDTGWNKTAWNLKTNFSIEVRSLEKKAGKQIKEVSLSQSSATEPSSQAT